MTKPFIATVELSGPFKILAKQIWIKAEDRTPPATGDLIAVQAVQVASSDPETQPTNLINRSGLQDRDGDDLDEHSVNPAQMWRSAPGETSCWLEFDLGSVQSLGSVSIWNYNDAWHTDQGVRKMDLSVWTSEFGWKKIREDLSIGQAQGSEDYDEPTVVKLDGVKAQKIRLDDLASFADTDCVGLSKVQFFESPGPKAIRPKPFDGDTDVCVYGAALEWTPGLKAVTHRMYLGVTPADLKLLGMVEKTSARLSGLAKGTTYYWRIDEVQDDETVTAGRVWSFTTGCDVTGPMDVVVGVPNEGVTTDRLTVGWPTNESPPCVTDDEVKSKYLHLAGEVRPTGFCTTPQAGPSVVTGLTFTTANDYEKRDPVSWELSGSNESIRGPYTLIARGEIVDFNQPTPWPRLTKNTTPIVFENDTAYKHYQVLFPAVRDPRSAECMQIAEVELLATPPQGGKPSMDGVRLEQAPAKNARVLAAWWKLDETGGDSVADSSGNGRHGVIHGDPAWLPSGGHVRGALQFDGVDDYVDTGWMPHLPTWTVATWVMSPAAPAQLSEASGPVHAQKNFQINWNHGSGDFRGAAGFSCGGTWHAAGFGDLKPNVWYHLAATYDGENLKAYKDGILVQDNPAPSGDSDQEKLTLKLGRHGLVESFFAGAVDDVCVFAGALEADEVKALYDGKEPTTIVARPQVSDADAGKAGPAARGF